MQGEKMEDQDLLLLAENVEMKNSRDTKGEIDGICRR